MACLKDDRKTLGLLVTFVQAHKALSKVFCTLNLIHKIACTCKLFSKHALETLS